VATTSRNPDVKETYDHVLAGIPIVPGQAINQGDMVCWDSSLNSSNGGLRVVAAQADMATYMGVAMQQSPFASLGDVFNTIEVRRGGAVRFNTTAAETYKMFTKVFFSETVDAQTIVASTNSGARTVACGYIILPQQLTMSGATTLVGAAGVQVQVWLTPAFPVSTI
jgi:hypothetical protein